MPDTNTRVISTFSQIDKWGIDYIKKEQKYLAISGVYPVLVAIIQIYNIILILSRFDLKRPPLPNNQPPMIDLLTPFIVLLILAIFASIYFLYLLLWNKKLKRYQLTKNPSKNHLQTSENSESTSNTQSQLSLTEIFYDIVKFMNIAKIIFIIMNFIFLFYLQWLIRFILIQFNILQPINIQPRLFIQIINTIAQFGLILYMIYEWNHFLLWNRKLSKLSSLEKRVYDELNE